MKINPTRAATIADALGELGDAWHDRFLALARDYDWHKRTYGRGDLEEFEATHRVFVLRTGHHLERLRDHVAMVDQDTGRERGGTAPEELMLYRLEHNGAWQVAGPHGTPRREMYRDARLSVLIGEAARARVRAQRDRDRAAALEAQYAAEDGEQD